MRFGCLQLQIAKNNWKHVSVEMALEINISELRLVTNRILDRIEHDLGHASVNLDKK